MKSYNGHRSWNAWNVSLWISNDEPLYRRAYELAHKVGPAKGARILRRELDQRTPDGAVYNHLSVKLALEGLINE
jgi:hypothetical protein